MAADSDVWQDEIEDESDSGEDDDDSWFYASMKRYKNLHMFDLQQPTRVIEWIGEKSICVAGFDKDANNEIWELAVPERLLPSNVDEGLCKDRDFKLQGGGFTRNPVWSLRHVQTTTRIVTSETGGNSVHVYQLGQGSSDVINHVFEIKNPNGHQAEPANFDVDGNNVVFGRYVHDLCSADVISGQVSGRSTNTKDEHDLSCVQLVTSGVVAGCVKSSGQLHLIDTREKFQVMQSTSPVDCGAGETPSWTMAVGKIGAGAAASSGDWTTTLLGCLSSTGHVTVTDVRNLKGPIAEVVLPQKIAVDGDRFLKLQFAPHNSGMISVSGYDGNVCIYNSSPWQGRVPFASPVFVHDGHCAGKRAATGHKSPPMLVTTHGWHPLLPNIILSAGTDKSLHAWQWQIDLE